MKKEEKLKKKLRLAWSNFCILNLDAPEDDDDSDEALAWRQLNAVIDEVCDGKNHV